LILICMSTRETYSRPPCLSFLCLSENFLPSLRSADLHLKVAMSCHGSLVPLFFNLYRLCTLFLLSFLYFTSPFRKSHKILPAQRFSDSHSSLSY
jgi:hypothetical protein